MSGHTNVAVITVNYNGGEIVLRCLESLRSQTLRPNRILLVDNASQDNSLAVIEETFPEVEPFLSQKIWGLPRLIIWLSKRPTLAAGWLCSIPTLFPSRPGLKTW